MVLKEFKNNLRQWMNINNSIKYIGRAGNGGGTIRRCSEFVGMACASVMVVEDSINELARGRKT